jgi:hypothetical protein
MRGLAARAFGLLLLAALAGGCSKERGAPFDPDSSHPEKFFASHPAEYRALPEGCVQCHGDDLRGGISKTSCFSASFDGRTCHASGPGGHPAGWLQTHSVTPQTEASLCADCHKNPANNLPPNCFNNSLCHGPRSGHPAGWLKSHVQVAQTEAAVCAQCHDNPANSLPPGCFNNSLCHGRKNPHPGGWLQHHSQTVPTQAPYCAGCHKNPANNLPPDCFNNSLCHGPKGPHPSGWGSPSQHGAAAKGSPGMASCTACHGSGYTGGTTAPSCFPCHGWNAPHGKTGWSGGGGNHQSTVQANAGACALCHRSRAGAAGCFNNTLCHGSGG